MVTRRTPPRWVAVNRLGEKGRWNLDELKPEFEELILDEAPIEISGLMMRKLSVTESRKSSHCLGTLSRRNHRTVSANVR